MRWFDAAVAVMTYARAHTDAHTDARKDVHVVNLAATPESDAVVVKGAT
jgi:hypothetical protein